MRNPAWVVLDLRMPAQMACDMLGSIPGWLDLDDPRPAREQLGSRYLGGWSPFKGHELDPETRELLYPGDPPLAPVAATVLRDETVLVYRHGWVCVVGADGSHEICRMD